MQHEATHPSAVHRETSANVTAPPPRQAAAFVRHLDEMMAQAVGDTDERSLPTMGDAAHTSNADARCDGVTMLDDEDDVQQADNIILDDSAVERCASDSAVASPLDSVITTAANTDMPSHRRAHSLKREQSVAQRTADSIGPSTKAERPPDASISPSIAVAFDRLVNWMNEITNEINTEVCTRLNYFLETK